jgi:hypothetical protein
MNTAADFRSKGYMKTTFVFAAAIMVLTVEANASLFTDIRDTVTAPVRAVPEAIQNPNPENIVKAANPTAAQISEADKKLGVSETLKTTAGLPAKADSALESAKRAADNANQGVTEARAVLPGVKGAVDGARQDVSATRSDISAFLATISLPSKVLLWLLVAFMGVKCLRLLTPSRKKP